MKTELAKWLKYHGVRRQVERGSIDMSPIYWISGLVAICVLRWLLRRNNRNFREARNSKDLARENQRLRHVVAELTMDKHDPEYR